MRNRSSSAGMADRRFTDRVDAGRRLAERLMGLRGHGVVVLGLPRGGLPVAAEVAQALEAPLDVIVVRKLGVPFQPELAMGAIGEEGAQTVDEALVARTGVSSDELRSVEQRERSLLESRVTGLRRGRRRVDLRGRTAIIVDDGIATGSTARVACAVARHLGALRVVLAAPVAPSGAAGRIPEADEVVCLVQPARLRRGRVLLPGLRADHRRRGDRAAGRRPSPGRPAWLDGHARGDDGGERRAVTRFGRLPPRGPAHGTNVPCRVVGRRACLRVRRPSERGPPCEPCA